MKHILLSNINFQIYIKKKKTFSIEKNCETE